ncbi:MAG: hypothetical protein Kow0099_18110 [Candidatus Abyssubacteria bacterium]
MFRKQACALIAGLSLACLAACSAKIPPTNYYILGFSDTLTDGPPQARFPYTLLVEPFDANSVYQQRKIVWRSAPNELGYYPYDKWGALPTEMFTYRLSRSARESGLFQRVYPIAAPNAADLRLGGTLLAFEELDTPEGWFGHVRVSAELARADGTLLWSGEIEHKEPAAARTTEAVVEAIAASTETVIVEMLSSIERALTQM